MKEVVVPLIVLLSLQAVAALFVNRAAQHDDGHHDNWAIVVGTSRYWHNYRHTTNPLLLYRFMREHGVPDRNIVLMLAGDVTCDPRSVHPGCVHLHDEKDRCLTKSGHVEVDFRGEEVTVEAFLQVLTGVSVSSRLSRTSATAAHSVLALPHRRSLTRWQSIQPSNASNVFVYLTGHGGDGFLKFQDSQELTARVLANSLKDMHMRGRYREMLIISDTCQASSLFDFIDSPNILAIASSKTGQNAWSYGFDPENGISTTDRFTYFMHKYLQSEYPLRPSGSVGDLLRHLQNKQVRSVPHLHNTMNRSIDQVAISDFLEWRSIALHDEF